MNVRVLIAHDLDIAHCWDFFPECHIVHRSFRILQGHLQNANNNNNNAYNTLLYYVGARTLYRLIHKEHRNSYNKKIREEHRRGVLISRLINYL